VDPCDATLYCIASDNQYTMITGTQYNCLAILWDQRKTDFVQVLIKTFKLIYVFCKLQIVYDKYFFNIFRCIM